MGYDLETQAMVTAGLGGDWGMFSIREWVPQSSPQAANGQWKKLSLGGDRSNLKPGTPYQIEVVVNGSSIGLAVNNVQVAVTTLPSAITQARQIGIFFASRSKVIVSDVIIDVDRPKAFIVMQFSSPYNEVYSGVLKSSCEEFELEAVRADEIYGPGMIIRDVVEKIVQAQVIIADISPANPNVYFEVGYAFALGKPIILLSEKRPKENPLPFDISPFRVLFYDNSIPGKAMLEAGLRNHLREIVGGSTPVQPPGIAIIP